MTSSTLSTNPTRAITSSCKPAPLRWNSWRQPPSIHWSGNAILPRVCSPVCPKWAVFIPVVTAHRQLFVRAALSASLQLTPCAPSLSHASFRSFAALSLPVTCDYFFPLQQNALFFPEEITRHGDKNRKKGNNFLLAPRPGLETPLSSTVHSATKPTCERSSSHGTESCTRMSTRQNSSVLPLTSRELHCRKTQGKIYTWDTLALQGCVRQDGLAHRVAQKNFGTQGAIVQKLWSCSRQAAVIPSLRASSAQCENSVQRLDPAGKLTFTYKKPYIFHQIISQSRWQSAGASIRGRTGGTAWRWGGLGSAETSRERAPPPTAESTEIAELPTSKHGLGGGTCLRRRSCPGGRRGPLPARRSGAVPVPRGGRNGPGRMRDAGCPSRPAPPRPPRPRTHRAGGRSAAAARLKPPPSAA